MNQIGLTPTFEKSLAKLTNQERSLVKQVPTDFMLNPEKPGHRLHKPDIHRMTGSSSQYWLRGRALARPSLAVNGHTLLRPVKSALHVPETLILTSPRHTSPVVFSGTHAAGLFTPALVVVAAGVRRSVAGSRRTTFSEWRPRPSGRRHSDRG